MHFAIEQSLPASAEVVIAALLDPDFVACLGDLPNLAAPEVLDEARDRDVVRRRVRYQFTGSLSSAVTRVVDPSKVTWIEDATYDLVQRRATFEIVPDHYGGKLRCTGEQRFDEHDGTTTRSIDGDLTVSVPLVGRRVEKAIVSGLREHFDTEGVLLAEWLADR